VEFLASNDEEIEQADRLRTMLRGVSRG